MMREPQIVSFVEKGVPQAQWLADMKVFVESLEQEHERKQELGRGKTSFVWFTEDPFFHTRLCVKELHNPEPSINNFKTELTLHEKAFQAGAAVPRPLMFVETDAAQYIFMERIGGRSVKDMLDSGESLDSEAWRRFYKSLEQQIFMLHKKANIHHRDLHPGNIMVNERGEAVIIDFGDAKQTVSLDTDEDIYREQKVRDGKFIDVVLPKDRAILLEVSKLRAKAA